MKSRNDELEEDAYFSKEDAKNNPSDPVKKSNYDPFEDYMKEIGKIMPSKNEQLFSGEIQVNFPK